MSSQIYKYIKSLCFFVDCCWLIYCSDECGENRELNKKSFDKLMNSVSK